MGVGCSASASAKILSWCAFCALLSPLAISTADAAVGRTAGHFEVGTNGDAEYTIPLWTPPGTNQLAPKLVLRYSSSSGNGWVGIGMSIQQLPVIARCNATAAQDSNPHGVNFVPADKYCLDGQRLRHVSGTYGAAGSTYQTEIESFRRVTVTAAGTYGPTSWEVKTRAGLTYQFGGTADSQIRLLTASGGSLSSVPFMWAANRIRDTANNYIDFVYAQDLTYGGHYAQEIRWTGNTNGTAPQYKVTFINEAADRPDRISIRAGSSLPVGSNASPFVNYTKRLGRIEIRYLPTDRVVRRYQLTYDPVGGAGGLSRLQSVQEFGLDAADSLSPTNFVWTNASTGSASVGTTGQSMPAGVTPLVMDITGDGRDDLVWSSSATSGGGTWQYKIADAAGGFAGAINTSISNTNYSQAQMLQWDGDNKLDLIVPYSGGTWWVLRANGSGFEAPLNTGVAATFPTIFVDINGDSLDDMVRKFNGLSMRLRSGSTFGAETLGLSTAWPVAGIFSPNGKHRHDLDCDGMEDLVYVLDHVDALGNHTFKTYTAFGNATNLRSGLEYGVITYVGNGDFNGDQCADLAWISGGILRTSVNPATGPAAAAANLLIADWNGDGKDDALIQSGSTWNAAQSTGTGFGSPLATGLTVMPSKIGDVDGDTFDDVVGVDANVIKTIRHITPAPWQFRDLLQSATDGFGVAATFNYGSLNDLAVHTPGTAAYPFAIMSDASRAVVRSVSATDGTGTGSNYNLTYTYEGALWDDRGRGFVGFAKRSVVDGRLGYNVKTEEFFDQTWPYVRALKRTTLRQSSGTVISDTTNTWKTLTYSSGFSIRHFPYISTSITLHYELNGTHFRTTTSALPGVDGINGIDSVSGLLKDVTTTTTEVATGLSAGSFKAERVFHASFLNDTANWCLGRPQTTQVTSNHSLAGGGSITRTVGHNWDASKCRVDSRTLEPSDPQWQVLTTLQYDGFGNVSSQTITGAGMAGRATQVDWGTGGRFPLSITNALMQQTSQGFEAERGVQTSITDANLLTTSWAHDGFGRVTLETLPDGTKTARTFLACPTCDGRVRWRMQEEWKRSDNALIRTNNLYFDQFDRLLFHYGQLPGGASAVNTVNFDARGRISHRKNPIWAGQASGANGQWQIVYDALDRITAERLYDGSGALNRQQLHAYSGLGATKTDYRNNSSTRYLTAWGDLTQVTDAGSGASKYQYNGFSELLEIKDAYNSVTTSLTYNVRGMRLNIYDADMGAWTYLPNALGEIEKIRDAKTLAPNWTTQYVFDPVGRVTQRTEAEGVTSWTWGELATSYNVGLLTSVSGPGYSESFIYDSKSRVSQRNITTDVAYQINYGYHAQSGLLDSVTYPTSTPGYRFQLRYEYANGQLSKIRRADGALTEYWKLNTVDARGNILDELLGNGIQVASGFSPLTGLMDSRTAGPGGSATIQDLDYEWDLNGNLWKRHERRQTLSEVFVYDGLDRVTSSALNGSPNLTVSYDLIGNITSKSDVPGAWNYHATKRHAVTAAGSNSYTYDANGNALTKNGSAIEWTSFNLPLSISGGGLSSQFLYGPNRQRHRQTATYPTRTETTHYVGGILEKVAVSAPALTHFKHYIAGPTGIVATYVRRSDGSEDTFYFTKDHLGSVDSVSNHAGTVQVRLSYDAFGKRRNEAGWAGTVPPADLTAIGNTSRHGYTDHEMLDNLGLVHMNGRVQDPTIGRFISADPVVQDPFDSQSINRYSYVFNSPLTWVDPSGFCGATSVTEFAASDGTMSGLDHGSNQPSFMTPCPEPDVLEHVFTTIGRANADFIRVWVPDSWELGGGSDVYGADLIGDMGRGVLTAAHYETTNEPNFAALGRQLDAYQVRDAVEGAYWVMSAGMLFMPAGTVGGAATSNAARAGVATAESAQNVANGVRLAQQLSRQSANSAFTATGRLSPGAISGARQIMAPGTLGNPAIPKGFGKYATETFASPSGPFQVHFYMNSKTAEVLYGLDYKVVFNLGL